MNRTLRLFLFICGGICACAALYAGIKKYGTHASEVQKTVEETRTSGTHQVTEDVDLQNSLINQLTVQLTPAVVFARPTNTPTPPAVLAPSIAATATATPTAPKPAPKPTKAKPAATPTATRTRTPTQTQTPITGPQPWLSLNSSKSLNNPPSSGISKEDLQKARAADVRAIYARETPVVAPQPPSQPISARVEIQSDALPKVSVGEKEQTHITTACESYDTPACKDLLYEMIIIPPKSECMVYDRDGAGNVLFAKKANATDQPVEECKQPLRK